MDFIMIAGSIDIDHLILNEAEITLPQFIKDLDEGKPDQKYTSEDWADITATPLPMWELISMNNYTSMNLQYSRGCPFDCEFCNITSLFGHLPRVKTSAQILRELDGLYALGWREPVFFVDDNLIGNKKHLRDDRSSLNSFLKGMSNPRLRQLF